MLIIYHQPKMECVGMINFIDTSQIRGYALRPRSATFGRECEELIAICKYCNKEITLACCEDFDSAYQKMNNIQRALNNGEKEYIVND